MKTFYVASQRRRRCDGMDGRDGAACATAADSSIGEPSAVRSLSDIAQLAASGDMSPDDLTKCARRSTLCPSRTTSSYTVKRAIAAVCQVPAAARSHVGA